MDSKRTEIDNGLIIWCLKYLTSLISANKYIGRYFFKVILMFKKKERSFLS